MRSSFGGYDKHKIWDEITQNYSRYGQCAEDFWTPGNFSAKFNVPTEAILPYAPHRVEIADRIDQSIFGTGHAPADKAAQKTKEAADKANEFRTTDSTPSQKAESINTALVHIAQTGKELEKTVALLPAKAVSNPEVAAAYAAVTHATAVFTGYKANPAIVHTGYAPESNLAAMVTAVETLKTLAGKSPEPAFEMAAVPDVTHITTPDLPWSIESPISSTPTKNTGDLSKASGTLVNGFGPAGHAVTVKNQNGNSLCTATVTHLGIWACKPETPLTAGNELTLTDSGIPVQGITITVPGDNKPTIDPISSPVDRGALANMVTGFSGTGTPGHTLSLRIRCDHPVIAYKTFILPPVTVEPDGTWTYQPKPENMRTKSTCTLTITDKATNETTKTPAFNTTG